MCSSTPMRKTLFCLSLRRQSPSFSGNQSYGRCGVTHHLGYPEIEEKLDLAVSVPLQLRQQRAINVSQFNRTLNVAGESLKFYEVSIALS